MKSPFLLGASASMAMVICISAVAIATNNTTQANQFGNSLHECVIKNAPKTQSKEAALIVFNACEAMHKPKNPFDKFD